MKRIILFECDDDWLIDSLSDDEIELQPDQIPQPHNTSEEKDDDSQTTGASSLKALERRWRDLGLQDLALAENARE
jgi:hypothetical protein